MQLLSVLNKNVATRYSSKQLVIIIIKLYNIQELKNDASWRALLIFPSEVSLSSLQEGLQLITVYFW